MIEKINLDDLPPIALNELISQRNTALNGRRRHKPVINRGLTHRLYRYTLTNRWDDKLSHQRLGIKPEALLDFRRLENLFHKIKKHHDEVFTAFYAEMSRLANEALASDTSEIWILKPPDLNNDPKCDVICVRINQAGDNSFPSWHFESSKTLIEQCAGSSKRKGHLVQDEDARHVFRLYERDATTQKRYMFMENVFRKSIEVRLAPFIENKLKYNANGYTRWTPGHFSINVNERKYVILTTIDGRLNWCDGEAFDVIS